MSHKECLYNPFIAIIITTIINHRHHHHDRHHHHPFSVHVICFRLSSTNWKGFPEASIKAQDTCLFSKSEKNNTIELTSFYMYLSVPRIQVQPGRDSSQVSATASRSERFSRMPQQMIQQAAHLGFRYGQTNASRHSQTNARAHYGANEATQTNIHFGSIG